MGLEADGRSHGYADRICGRTVAVYEEGGQLWFQYGKDRFAVGDSNIRFSWTRKSLFTNEFTVWKNGVDYYTLVNQYPAYDVMDHPNIDGSEGGIMIHEMTHALFKTRDYKYYGEVPGWVRDHPGEGIDNADSYRMFAEHAYVH